MTKMGKKVADKLAKDALKNPNIDTNTIVKASEKGGKHLAKKLKTMGKDGEKVQLTTDDLNAMSDKLSKSFQASVEALSKKRVKLSPKSIEAMSSKLAEQLRKNATSKSQSKCKVVQNICCGH